jgi:hypothetical protein
MLVRDAASNMPCRMRVGVLLISVLMCCVLFGANGCASARKREKKEKPAPAPPQPVLVGTISLVNEESKFVLIDAGLLPTPPPELALKTYTKDVESGELLTSRERRRPFIIADIKSGAPQKGDRVFTAVATAKPPAASAADPISNAPPIGGTKDSAPDFLPPIQLSAP